MAGNGRRGERVTRRLAALAGRSPPAPTEVRSIQRRIADARGSLAGYLLAPLAPILATRTGLDQSVQIALTVTPVLALVWWSNLRLRKRIGGRGGFRY